MEGAFAKNAVKGIASGNPLKPRRGMLKGPGKAKKEKPAKPIKVQSERITEPPINVKSERVTKEEPQQSGPINVKSERIYPTQAAIGQGQRSISAPPAKKASKPRKPRDVKYTQPTLPGMRNTRQFKSPNGKP